jgi:hypothetical protein
MQSTLQHLRGGVLMSNERLFICKRDLRERSGRNKLYYRGMLGVGYIDAMFSYIIWADLISSATFALLCNVWRT